MSDDKWAVAAKRQKIERSGPPVVLLTGISQSIARKLKEVGQTEVMFHLVLFSLRPSSCWGVWSVTDRDSVLILWHLG